MISDDTTETEESQKVYVTVYMFFFKYSKRWPSG